jgi:amino acid transporter
VIDDVPGSEPGESPKQRADRELIELLNEVRVALPGVTVLFGFLLAVPFARGWSRVTTFQSHVFLSAFLASAVSVALLTAPTAYHRLRFREVDKERLVKLGNALAIGGIVFLAVAMTAGVVLVTDFILPRGAAIGAGAAVGATLFALWVGFPLVDRLRGR